MRSVSVFVGIAAIAAVSLTSSATARQAAPIKFASAKVTITGTTNVHGYTAETSTVRLTSVKTGDFQGDLMTLVQTPALLQAFDITIPAASLHSTKDGIDKNMHKALKVDKFANITFRMKALETKMAGTVRATGTLTIAGVSKEVAFDLEAARAGSNLSVVGELPLLMTDYGIVPPKAMLGMMKTDPKITIRLELVLAAAIS